ncbi:hypothetical protein M409DRAFT_48840 [Zasmidium cellare ATCC 36951]|uniref:Uncharacterized protein n=1 Tax=Zasmidium cellare ATCC 36951 TaxID=1080233 RepID=A0A6A6D475_ZASCE|nr:uncharacterized protein M409DRAFT_48840 [Zasmidium cellare ATCC 36951]KAF2173933.1 hypothetical protein M409DRAFT_48840 [Zasmidium cellare ATCC 36951]
MPPKALAKAPKSFGKRASLRDQLDRITTVEGEEGMQLRFEMIEELEQDVEAAKTFRWHAASTQKRQDYHLEMYKYFYFTYIKKESSDGLSDDEVDLELFPDDYPIMSRNMQLFVTWVSKKAIPRAKAAGSIDMRTLCQYRDSLLFWSSQKLRHRGTPFPGRAQLFNDLVQTMRFVQKQYGDTIENKPKTYLGLAELRQLLDHEAVNNRCIELSEEHQVLWCIGRISALRPSSLAPDPKVGRSKPLKWKDFEFFTTSVPGKFRSILTLDHLDIKRSSDPIVAQESRPSTVPVRLNMPSPEPHNLVFSVTHRLLVIALRRGILEGIGSLDDLLTTNLNEIRVKRKYLDDTVFYRGIPKGTAVDIPYPLAAHSLTSYLRLRGKQIGYTSNVSWYSIRRRAATDMALRIGLAATRIFLGHAPDSFTLERHYLNMSETLDNTGILLAQDIQQGGASTEQTKNWNDLALGKLDGSALQRSRGQALEQLVRRLILADEDPPAADASNADLKNYRRRVRTVAREILVEQEEDSQNSRMTRQEMDERQAQLDASNFAKAVLERALKAIREGRDNEVDLDDDGAEAVAEAEMAAAAAVDEEYEADLEDTIAQREKLNQPMELDEAGAITLTPDNDVDAESTNTSGIQDVAYIELARSMMEILLENQLSAHANWSEQNQTCPLCQEDDSVMFSDKMKPFKSPAALDVHLNSHFHHPYSEWKRNQVKHDGKFTCGYCVRAELEEPFAHVSITDLTKHILESNEDNTSDLHDKYKHEDGWYTEEMQNALDLGPTQASINKYRLRGAKRLKEAGVDTTPLRHVEGVQPYPASDSLVRGSHPHGSLPSRYGPFVHSEPMEVALSQRQPLTVPPHLESVLQTGFNDQLSELPEEMREDVEMTNAPARAEASMDLDM